MRMKTLVILLTAACAAVVTSAALGFAAQTAPQKTADAAIAAHQEADAKVPAIKAADTRQDALVARMHAASGNAKTQAIAALATGMVASRRVMQDGTMRMQYDMMGHMAAHIQAANDSMTECPMMQPMVGKTPVSDIEH